MISYPRPNDYHYYGYYWTATSDEEDTAYMFFCSHNYLDKYQQDYYWGTPIRAVFSID